MQKSHARSRLAVGAILSISSLSLLTDLTGSAAADPITLQQALDRADQRPTVAMATASSEAARHHAEQAGLATYNPELSVAAGPRSVDGDRDLAVQLGLAQTFELGGKRQARRAVAAARIEAAAAEQSAARTLARLETWRAFQLALIARERVVSANEAEQVAIQIEAATVERQKVGFGTQLELNLTNAEVGRARHERLDAERKHEEALALLASSVGAGAAEQLEPAGTLAPPPEQPASVEELLARAMRRRPEAVAARASARVAGAEVRLANAGAVPDLSLGVSYGYERDPGATAQTLLATAQVGLPIGNRNQGARKAARSMVRRAELEVAWTSTEIERSVRLSLAGYRRAREAVLGFDREVNERLHDNLELARESYTSGKIDYFQFNVVRRELLASRSAYLDALEETVEAWSAVQHATGAEVIP